MSASLRDSIVQIDEYRWMLPRRGGMRVPGILFASRPLLDKMLSDRSPEQVMNAAHPPGILDASNAMPDAQMIHCGSRGLGHPVCTDHVRDVSRKFSGWGITLPDRQLACAPLRTAEAEACLGAMRAAADDAWANRQFIADEVRRAFESVLERSAESLGLTLIDDVAHNIAKFESHETALAAR